jgi:hypothetical protein
MHAENGWDASGLALLRALPAVRRLPYHIHAQRKQCSHRPDQMVRTSRDMDLERLFSRRSSFRFLDASLEVTRMLAIASCNP